MHRNAILTVPGTAALAAALASPAAADSFTWNSATGGNWDDASKWSPNTGFPDAIGDEARFEQDIAGTLTITQNVPTGVTVGRMYFEDPTPSNRWTISGNPVIFQVASGSAELINATLRVDHGPATLNSDLRVNTTLSNGEVRFFSSVSGSGGLTKDGPGNLGFYGAAAYAGDTVVLAGSLTVTETSGRLVNTALIDARTGTTLNIQSQVRPTQNRLPDTAEVRIQSAKLFLRGEAQAVTEERFGELTLATGYSRLQLDTNGNDRVNQIVAGSLAREGRATLVVKGLNVGSAVSDPVGTGARHTRFILDTAPTDLIGSGSDTGTTISIVPYMVGHQGQTQDRYDGNTFVTYDTRTLDDATGVRGYRPLTTAEFDTAINTATATTNIRKTASEALTADRAINSLVLSGNGRTISGAFDLTVNSGAILLADVADGQTGTISTAGLQANGQELVLTATSNTSTRNPANPVVLNISSAISDADGLTKSGEGRVTLSGSNTYTGPTTINAGSLRVTDTGTLGDGDLVVRPLGTLISETSDAIDDAALVTVDTGGLIDLADGVLDTIGSLNLGGTLFTAIGTYGGTGSGADFIHADFFTGTGALQIIPEPASLALLGVAGLLLAPRVRRRPVTT